jgi:hypothetical protein
MMAPTKAKATYAVTTLSRLTKGLMKGIGSAPWVHVVPAQNVSRSKVFPAEKVSVTVHPEVFGAACGADMVKDS